MADITVTEARAALASDALYEITLISQQVRQILGRLNDDAEPLGRGMLARVQALSEAVSAIITPQADSRTDAQLTETIYCGNPPPNASPPAPPKTPQPSGSAGSRAYYIVARAHQYIDASDLALQAIREHVDAIDRADVRVAFLAVEACADKMAEALKDAEAELEEGGHGA